MSESRSIVPFSLCPLHVTNLVEVAPHTPLPLLAEVWKIASAPLSPSRYPPSRRRRRRDVLTGVGNLLVVLDRLDSGNASVNGSSNAAGAQSRLQSLGEHATDHCAGCGSSPRSLWLSKKSPVVKRMQFGGRLHGGATKILAGLGNPTAGGVWVRLAKISHWWGGALTGGWARWRQLPVASQADPPLTFVPNVSTSNGDILGNAR